MSTREEAVMDEYYDAEMDETNAAKMALEIVRLRAWLADDTWALVDAVRVVCASERPDDLAHLRAMLDAWDNHLLPEDAL